MSHSVSLDEDVVTIHEPLYPTDNDLFSSDKPINSKVRLYMSLMKPGRLTYWLSIHSSIVKIFTHYFGFIIIPCLMAVLFTTLRTEINLVFSYRKLFTTASWHSINPPVAFIISVLACIVVIRFIRTIIHITCVPKHLIQLQCGRFLFFLGLILSFTLFYCKTVDFLNVNDYVILTPICLGWLISFPLIYCRIRGLTIFMHKWHTQNSDTNEHDISRLFMWKAAMFKGQVIIEQFCYTMITWFTCSVIFVTYRIVLPISKLKAIFIAMPFYLTAFACILILILSFPILFSYLPPWRKQWQTAFGVISLSTAGKALEIIARLFLFCLLLCVLLLSLLSGLAWHLIIVYQYYNKAVLLLKINMILSIIVAVIQLLLLLIRIEMGSHTEEHVINQIADSEVGDKSWRDMLQHLPSYLIRSEIGVYSELPSHVSLKSDITQSEPIKENDNICIICMEKLANSVLLPCGHGDFCFNCAKLLYQQMSRRSCPLCRHSIQQVAKIKQTTSMVYDTCRIYSVDKDII